MPQTGQRIEMHPNFRFRVEIQGVNHAVFTECKLPSLQIETQEIKEGGMNNFVHQLPVRVKAGSITLKYGITKSDALLEWYLKVLQAMMRGNLKDVMYPVTITMLNVQRQPMATFNLLDAYPKKWSGPTLKADDKAIAIEELELAFTDFVVE
jgi:phage tail-like protein